MQKIKLLIVDDHPIVSEGLELLLNQVPGMMVLETAQNGQVGLAKLRRTNPDVVILDLGMPDLDGFQSIPLFLGDHPQLKILIFSGHTEEKFVYQSFRAGAHGYVVKGSAPEELTQAIDYIYKGGYYVSPQLSIGVVESYLKNLAAEETEISAIDSLSSREQQVFRLIVDGKDTHEISDLLCISETTVAKHRISLMRKLNIKNNIELTKFAIRIGLVEA